MCRSGGYYVQRRSHPRPLQEEADHLVVEWVKMMVLCLGEWNGAKGPAPTQYVRELMMV